MYLKEFCFILLFTIAVVAGGKKSKASSSSNPNAPIVNDDESSVDSSLIRFQVTQYGPSAGEGTKVLEEDQCFCSGVVINAKAGIALTSKTCAQTLKMKKYYQNTFCASSARGDTFTVTGYVGLEKVPHASRLTLDEDEPGLDDLAIVMLEEARNQISIPTESRLEVLKAFTGEWNYDQKRRTWKAIHHELGTDKVAESWHVPAFLTADPVEVNKPPVSFCRSGAPAYIITPVGTRLYGIRTDLVLLFINVRKFSAQITNKTHKIVSGEEKIIPF